MANINRDRETNTNRIDIRISGTPIAQGSKSATIIPKLPAHLRGKHRAQLFESSKKLAPWRKHVEQVIADSRLFIAGPVFITMVFEFERPKSHYRTGKSTGHLLKSDAPKFHQQDPDLDKLTRAVNDAMVCITDDNRVIGHLLRKIWIPRGQESGVRIIVTPATKDMT